MTNQLRAEFEKITQIQKDDPNFIYKNLVSEIYHHEIKRHEKHRELYLLEIDNGILNSIYKDQY